MVVKRKISIVKKRQSNRKDREYNSVRIEEAFFKLIVANDGKRPTTRQIAKETKLSHTTVENHLKEFDFSELYRIYKLGIPKVINNVFKKAATSDDPRWAKLYAEWIIGITKKIDVTTGGEKLNSNTTIIKTSDGTVVNF